MGSVSESFDYSTLKNVLKDTTVEILFPNDGDAYEKSILRWSDHCIKRAVSRDRLRVPTIATVSIC